MHGRPLSTRFVALTLVVGGHVLLVMLFSASRSDAIRTASVEPQSHGALILVELRPPPEELRTDQIDARSATDQATTRRRDRSEVESELPVVVAETQAPISEIDWRLEAERTAREMAPELLEQHRRKCEDSDPPGWVPPECRKRNYESDWEPEPKRIGMQGLLPYIRVGKRCVVGLGFFGCGIGKLPEADGDLFDDMGDPNRPRSSVPDIPGQEPAQ